MDPVEEKLIDAIAAKLMEFVVHNQTPYSDELTKFIATGCHDLRAGLIALEIINLCKDNLWCNGDGEFEARSVFRDRSKDTTEAPAVKFENYFTLYSESNGYVKPIGKYSTKEELIKAIDIQSAIEPNYTLTYCEMNENYPDNPIVWDWAYIKPDAKVEELTSGGSVVCIPLREFWGTTLLSFSEGQVKYYFSHQAILQENE